jgi:hypothetical protein
VRDAGTSSCPAALDLQLSTQKMIDATAHTSCTHFAPSCILRFMPLHNSATVNAMTWKARELSLTSEPPIALSFFSSLILVAL